MHVRRQKIITLEPLEPRALLVGFYDGPSPIPVQFNLNGTVVTTAVVRPATAGHSETIAIKALGRIAPLGPTTITGSLRIVAGVEKGTLVLDSKLSTLPLLVSGAAPAVGSPSSLTLPYVFNGRGAVPNTLFSSQRELGSGTVTLTLAPGSGRVRTTLVFHPASSGPAEIQL
jgi:hypothetical protein